MRVLVAVLLFYLNAICLAEVYGKCCVPEEWEGQEGELSGSNFPETNMTITQIGAQIAYSSVKKMIALNTSTFVDGTVYRAMILMDYHQDTAYTVVNGKCMKNAISTPFPPRCLPDNAKKIAETYFGAGSNRLDFVVYQIDMNGRTLQGAFTKDCIPISQTMIVDKKTDVFFREKKKISVTGFTGIVPTLKDTSVFDVPTACTKSGHNDDKDILRLASQIRRKKNFFGF